VDRAGIDPAARGRHNPALSGLPTRSMSDTPTPSPAPAPITPADCALQLRQLFPALFAGPAKPLKLRIQIDIQERAPGRFTKPVLSAFFRRLTGSTSYLLAVSKATHRFDLDGQPAGELSAEHRQVALDELARRRGNQDARRELEEQQRRNRAGLLHDYQSTTLTVANFCALKGVAVEELDGLLQLARNEAEERARAAPVRHAPEFDRRRRPGPPSGGPPRSRPPR
jgi:ProP effector